MSASQMRPASTVRKMSAGLLAPSAFIRAISSSGVPSMRFTWMPVGLGEVVVERLVGVVVPRGIDVHLVGQRRGGGEGGERGCEAEAGGLHAGSPISD